MALPGEGGAEKGEGFACAGGGFKEGVAVALPLGAVEGSDDAAHEGELRTIGLVGEVDGDSPDLVHVRVFFGSCRVHVRRRTSVQWGGRDKEGIRGAVGFGGKMLEQGLGWWKCDSGVDCEFNYIFIRHCKHVTLS